MATCGFVPLPHDLCLLTLHYIQVSSLPCPVYEGMALIKGISVLKTSLHINACIPFCPSDMDGVLNATNPFIK